MSIAVSSQNSNKFTEEGKSG